MRCERHGRRHAELRAIQQDVAVSRLRHDVCDGVGQTHRGGVPNRATRGATGMRARRDADGARACGDKRCERPLRDLADAAVSTVNLAVYD